jgi:predicted nucleic acid-binding protein
LDTSVLVAAFYGEHPNHEPSFGFFLRQKKVTGCTAAPCLAEVYATLTGMPGKDRATPDEALLFLGDVRDRLSVFALTGDEYSSVLIQSGAIGISGGGIYDALIAQCFLKSKAEMLFTWNVKHFLRLASPIAKQAQVLTAHTSLTAAVKGNQPATIDTLAAQLGTYEGQIASARSEAQAAFYAILTADQQTKFDSLPGAGGAFRGARPPR